MRIIILLLLLGTKLYGAPFLICDAYPANADSGLNVTTFVVTGLAADPINVQATINPDGTQYLHYDVGNLGNGNYTVTAAAINGYLMESAPSLPFTFSVGAPGSPQSLQLSPI
jgi:hypothetical protein